MTEPEQRSDVCGAQRQALLIGLDRFVGERGGREGGAALEVRLRVIRFKSDRAIETLERLCKPVLLLAQKPKVQERCYEIGRHRDRALEELFRLVGMPGLQSNRGKQAHRIDVARTLPEDTSIELLGLLQTPFLVMFGRKRHQAPLRRQREAALEGLIGVCTATLHGERLAEREPRALERWIQMRRTLEKRDGIVGVALLDEQVSKVLVGLGEARGLRDHLPEQHRGLVQTVPLYEQRAEQRLEVDVAWIIREPAADALFGGGEVTGLDECDRFVEMSFGGVQRNAWCGGPSIIFDETKVNSMPLSQYKPGMFSA